MDIIRQENVIKNNAKRNMKIIKDNIGNLNLSEKNNWNEKMNLGRFRKRSKRNDNNNNRLIKIRTNNKLIKIRIINKS